MIKICKLQALQIISLILVFNIYLLAEPSLVLNGTGKRQATIFRVNVYEAKLYLENKSHNPEDIINSKQDKKLVLFFLRDVSKSQINEAWQDGFERNSAFTIKLQNKLAHLQSMMSDVKKNDQLTFYWNNSAVQILLNNNLVTTIEGNDFQKALMLNWLGETPPNQSLKEGLLGNT